MKSARNTFLLMGALFLTVGLICMGVALGSFISNERLMETGVSAPGVLSRIENRNTWFSFEADGKVWERRMIFSSGFWQEGDPVTVWYPAGHPEQARLTEWVTWGVYLIVGGVFAPIGAAFLGVALMQIMKKRLLMASGTPVAAQVTEVVQLSWIRINRVAPYIIRAVCVHPYTGQEMKVKSEMLMENPQPHIQNNEVTVLVDPMRDNRYYVKVGE